MRRPDGQMSKKDRRFLDAHGIKPKKPTTYFNLSHYLGTSSGTIYYDQFRQYPRQTLTWPSNSSSSFTWTFTIQ